MTAQRALFVVLATLVWTLIVVAIVIGALSQ